MTFTRYTATLFALTCALSLTLATGCGSKAKKGEACEANADCEAGLFCANKACEAPKAEVRPASEGADEGGADLGEATGSAAAKTTWEVFRVARDKKEPWLNVRAKNKAKSDKVAQLSEGTEVAVLETKGKWRNIAIKSGEHKGTQGWAHICCLKPKGAKDLYWARLGADDHYSSSGTALQSAPGIVRQDRANFHKFKVRDKREDRDDDLYDDKKARAELSSKLKESLDKETKAIIFGHQPLIEVVTWEDRVDLTIIEKGPKHEMEWGEADAICGKRYCKCISGKGKCKDRMYKACMKKRGHKMTAGCERAH